MVILILWLRLSLLGSVLSSIRSVNKDGSCDTFSPDAVMSVTEPVRKSRSRSPFNVSVSSKVYGNRSHITVSIKGPANSSFLVQMHSLTSGSRVGSFRALSVTSVQSIACQVNDDTIMATVRPLSGTNISFQWLPPSTDKGIIVLMGTFISGPEYWLLMRDGPWLSYRQSDTSNKANGCAARQNDSNLCQDTECEYHLHYEIIDGRTRMKVKMKADGVKPNVYLGLALANSNIQEIHDIMLVHCIFTGTNVKVGGTNVVLMNKRIDFEKETFSCDLLISLIGPNQSVNHPSHIAYFWGSSIPHVYKIILPSAQSIKNSFQPIIPNNSTEKPCHFKYVHSSSRHCTSSSVILIISIIINYTLSFSVKITR